MTTDPLAAGPQAARGRHHIETIDPSPALAKGVFSDVPPPSLEEFLISNSNFHTLEKKYIYKGAWVRTHACTRR